MSTPQVFAETFVATSGQRRRVHNLVRSARVRCSVAHTEGDRTVLVRLEGGSDPDHVGSMLHAGLGVPVFALGVAGDGSWGLRLWDRGRQVLRHRWPGVVLEPGVDDLPPDQAAALLAAVVARPVDPGLVALLEDPRPLVGYRPGSRGSSEQLRHLLARVVEDPGPPAVVLALGDRAAARIAAAMCGPTWSFSPGPRWTLQVPGDGGFWAALPLAAGLAAAAGRRPATVLLWRSGDGSGYQLWRGGTLPDDEHAWGGPRDLKDDAAGGDAVLVAAAMDRPGAATALQAVLDADAPPALALRRFVQVLGLPPECLVALDDYPGWIRREDVVLVPRASPRAVVAQEVRRDLAGDSGPGAQRAWARTRVALGVYAGSVAVVGTTVLLTTSFFDATLWGAAGSWALVTGNAAMAVSLFRAGAAAHRRLEQPPVQRAGGREREP